MHPQPPPACPALPCRDARLPAEAIPELQAAAERAGLDWSKFIVTDNSCPPHPPERTLPERLQVASVRRAAQVSLGGARRTGWQMPARWGAALSGLHCCPPDASPCLPPT